jgi:hypothetical protein
MLETIREYGAERLAGRGEADELRRRHAAHYSALMREAEPRLRTHDQLRWVAWLRADRDNILAALRYWCDTGEAGNALALAVSLSIMALLLGNDTDMAEWSAQALAVPGEADPGLRAIAEALYVVTSSIGPTAPRPGEGEAVTAYPDLAERLDAVDIEEYPVAGLLRAVYATFNQDEGRVRRYLDEARGVLDEWLAAASWAMAAGMAENEGNPGEMRAAAAEALARFRMVGERWGLSSALQSVGTIRMLDGDLDGAAAAYTEAGRLLVELGSREDLGQVQLRLAEIAVRRGDLAGARELAATARSAAESAGSPVDRGIAAACWAAFEIGWGNIEAARPLQAAAERQLAQFGPAHPARRHMEAMVAATAARIAIAEEDLRVAREQAGRSYRAAVRAQDMSLFALASCTAAELALAVGQPERAAELLGASAVVRGCADPTDPTAAKLAPLLREALGADRYASAYQAGEALSRAEAIERLDPASLG